MAIRNILKGLIGKEDLAFGSGTFQRLKSDGTSQTLTKIGFSSFLEGAVTPQDYGATGDGVTDDWVGLQTAFDQGGLIIIPPGTYITSIAPLIINSDFATVLNFGTIKLAEGATRPITDGLGQKATAVLTIRDCQGVTFRGGVIDGNAQNTGPNGIAIDHNIFYRSEPGEYCYRCVVDDVTIRNCLHDVDADPGGLTPHNGGLGNGGGKGVTVQFGSPQCQLSNIRVHDCAIGMSYEMGYTLERQGPDLSVNNFTAKDCIIGLFLPGMYGPSGGSDMGADEYSAIFTNVNLIDCGVGNEPAGLDITATNFGVITGLRCTNVQMRSFRIRNSTAVKVTPFRGQFRNCHFDGEVDAVQIEHLFNFKRDLNGAIPGYVDSPSLGNEFDIRLKLRGAGVAGDQVGSAIVTDAAGDYQVQNSDFRISFYIGNGANNFTGKYSELTTPFFENAEGEDFHISNHWEIMDRGSGKWAIGSGILRNASLQQLDGLAPAFSDDSYVHFNNLWVQNDQNAGIVRLKSADRTPLGLGMVGGSGAGTACYVPDDAFGLYIVHDGWDGRHLRLGAYHLWVDATGDLRIKSSTPTSDTDGTIVGTQS